MRLDSHQSQASGNIYGPNGESKKHVVFHFFFFPPNCSWHMDITMGHQQSFGTRDDLEYGRHRLRTAE